MKFWQMLTWMEPEQMMDVARFAEEVGFRRRYARRPRRISPRCEIGVTRIRPTANRRWRRIRGTRIVGSASAAMAAITQRLKFSVSVYVLPLRNPFEVARATGSLDIFSKGRFILGIGAGWMKDEFDIYGVDFHTRGKRMDEMVTILRKFWQGGMVEHRGEFFNFDAAGDFAGAGSAGTDFYRWFESGRVKTRGVSRRWLDWRRQHAR